MGRNPATGEPLKIPAKTVVKMRVVKAAKEATVPSKKKKGYAGRMIPGTSGLKKDPP